MRPSWKEARSRGAVPTASSRMEEAFANLDLDEVDLLCAGGVMGSRLFERLGFKFTVVYDLTAPTSAEDTKAVCKVFVEAKVDLIVFGGGDGRHGMFWMS